jgi:phosphatidylethanolamine/phosphatidyl-N-methylethanolamine N-methyltransferase
MARGDHLLNTNRWNRLRYGFWAPVYDVIGRRFDPQRRASIRLLDPRPGERVLIVGAGTGADLPYLPAGLRVLATDLTPGMLARARPRAGEQTSLAVMDGHRLGVRDAAFDAVVLHLILAVLPDPVRCLQEAARALRPGGRAVVFDKFTRGRPSARLRVLNVAASALFTDITRNFEDILRRAQAPLAVEQDRPAILGGFFRHILLRKGTAARPD